jgi:hypothetical protein
MKIVIIVINILLLSLILYTLLSSGDKLIENMAGCPGQESWTKKCYGFISGKEACKRDFGAGTTFLGKEKACEFGGLDAQYLCKKKETAAQTNKKLLDRLYQEVSILDSGLDQTNTNVKKGNDLADKNEKNQKAFMQDINNQKKEIAGNLGSLLMMKPGKDINISSVSKMGKLFNQMSLQG